jgi:prolipoprotein diacylglyceryltransferase
MVLFVFFTWLMYVRPTRPPTGTIIGLFCLSYGTLRFLSDFIRVNDRTVLGLTGAQFLMLSLLPAGIWILFRVRRLVAADEAAGVPAVGAGAAAEPASAGTRPDAPAGSAVPPDSGEATEVP